MTPHVELKSLPEINSALLSWEPSSCYPGNFQFALGSLTACVEVLKLHPGSDIQRALFYRSLVVKFYICTAKNLSILAQTIISLVSI